jgi:PAS domain-containing protein
LQYEVAQEIIAEPIKDQIQFDGLLNKVVGFTRYAEDRTNTYIELLEGVLKGIQDIIRVFNTDRTILFLNEAGYAFYKKSRDEVKGKKCFEILGGKECCHSCDVERAIRTKRI